MTRSPSDVAARVSVPNAAPVCTATPGFHNSRESPPEELRRRYMRVVAAAADAGHDPHEVKLHCCLSVEVTSERVEQEPDILRGTPEQVAEALERFAEVGVEHWALQFLVGRYPERVVQMERLAPLLLR